MPAPCACAARQRRRPAMLRHNTFDGYVRARHLDCWARINLLLVLILHSCAGTTHTGGAVDDTSAPVLRFIGATNDALTKRPRDARRETPETPSRDAPAMCWPLLAAVSLALTALGEAYTAPDELRKLIALRAELMKPERGVADKLSSWRCPTDLFGNCDPCGAYSGNDAAFGDDGGGWAYVACRRYDISERETSAEILGIYYSRGSQSSSPGVVTNIHITGERAG